MTKFAKKEKMTAAEKESEATKVVDKKTGEVHKVPPFATKAGRAASKKDAAKRAKDATVAKEAKSKAKPAKAAKVDEDKKIVVLKKDHGAREGTKRAKWFDIIISSKTTAQAQEKAKDLNSGVIREAVRQGIIKLA